MFRKRARVQLVTFVTRQSCSMCAEALPIVERVAGRAGVPVTVVDVDADPALREWSDHVPVVLLDGVLHSRWFVDAGDLKRALV